MADEKPNPDKKQTAKKAGGAKKATAKKAAPKKAGASKTKKAAKAKPKKTAAKKATAKSSSKASSKKSSARPTVGIDKSFAQLKDSLEHSVTLSRDRIQEVVDDAVKRGRMTHGDAEKMIGELYKRGRKQTDALLSELDKIVRQARRKLP